MPKVSDLPTYEFIVHTLGSDGLWHEDRVHASYYQEAGQFTQLKDAGHTVVDAFRTDTVRRVQRMGEPSYEQ